MKRKILFLAFFILMCLMLLSSCGEKHEWSEWELYSSESDSCEDKIYKRYCIECNEVQLQQGSHDYGEDILYDKEYHWYECKECGAKKDKSNHTLEENTCTKCEYIFNPTEGIIYEVSEDGTYAIVVGYEGTKTELVIANRYNDLPVTSIGDYAFRYCHDLTSVMIPDSVTSIGDEAFCACDSLTSVVIGDSVTSIGDRAFRDCTSLTSIVIPDSVTSIGRYAFIDCSSLTSVVIGDGVTSIGVYAFFSCENLADVYYDGTEEDWGKISIGSWNDNLKDATRYYYSEEEPGEEGNFWHWGENGEVVIWE